MTGKVFIAAAVLCIVAGVAMSVAAANDDFTLRVIVNGNDVTSSDAFTVDPDEPLTVELQFTHVTTDVVLREVLVTLTFAGQTVYTESRPLGQELIAAGEDRTEVITVRPGDFLKAGDITLATGIYGGRFRVRYTTSQGEQVWRADKNIRIPGNPLTTPAGAVGAAVGLTALTSLAVLGKAAASPAMAAAGTVLPADTVVDGTSKLRELLENRLEPTARGKVTGNLVKAAKGRIVRDRCPLDGEKLVHGYCPTHRKSAGELRTEYRKQLQELSLAGGELIASGQAATLGEITTLLGVSGKLATDVVAVLRHARLVKVRGLARKVAGKALLSGISSGVSAVIWMTVGGFAALSMGVLVAILAASVAVPLLITTTLKARTKRRLRRTDR
jgi:hypothetical protein